MCISSNSTLYSYCTYIRMHFFAIGNPIDETNSGSSSREGVELSSTTPSG